MTSPRNIEDYYLASLSTVSEAHAWGDAKRNAGLACKYLGHVAVVPGELGSLVEEGTCSRCLQPTVTTEQVAGLKKK